MRDGTSDHVAAYGVASPSGVAVLGLRCARWVGVGVGVVGLGLGVGLGVGLASGVAVLGLTQPYITPRVSLRGSLPTQSTLYARRVCQRGTGRTHRAQRLYSVGASYIG